MDFAVSAQQRNLIKRTREFCSVEIAPRVHELEESGEFPFDIAKKMGDAHLLGLCFPKEYGGGGLGCMEAILVVEEIAKVDASLAFFNTTSIGGPYVIYRYGTLKQKRKYLPPIFKGEALNCDPITEPSGGSNPSAMRSTAKRVGDKYIINGHKIMATLGGISNTYLYTAKAEEGLSIIIIEKDTPGFTAGPRMKYCGFGCLPITHLILRDCRVPVGNLLGEPGKAMRMWLDELGHIARAAFAAMSLGIAESAYEIALNFAKKRTLYGKPIAELQSIQFMLADIHVDIEASRWLVYNHAWAADNKENQSLQELLKSACMAKLHSNDQARRTVTKAIQVLGGYGTLVPQGLMTKLHDSLQCIPSAGTLEIQRQTIGQTITRPTVKMKS